MKIYKFSRIQTCQFSSHLPTRLLSFQKLAEDIQASIAKANDVAEEVLSAVRTVKSFAAEKFEAIRFLGFLDHTLSIGAKKAIAHIGFLWTTEFLQMGILTVVLFYGGHLVIQKQITSGLLVSFLLYQFQLGENLRVGGKLVIFWPNWKKLHFLDIVPKIWPFIKAFHNIWHFMNTFTLFRNLVKSGTA